MTSSAGDNNGFEVNPANAQADGGGVAQDVNSGTNNSSSCTNNGKDKHRFYNYNISLPGGATVKGIEVRLDAFVDAVGSNAPKMCVQLSWDGGTTWTTAKQTATLTTAEATYVLGGAADTWGRTWTAANLSNTNFRVRVIDVASGGGANRATSRWIGSPCASAISSKTSPSFGRAMVRSQGRCVRGGETAQVLKTSAASLAKNTKVTRNLRRNDRRGSIKHIGEAQVAVAAVVDDLAREVRIGRGVANGGDDLLGGAALAFGDLLGGCAIGSQPAQFGFPGTLQAPRATIPVTSGSTLLCRSQFSPRQNVIASPGVRSIASFNSSASRPIARTSSGRSSG